MLPLRLKQIKDLIKQKMILSKEELEFLNELNFLEENEAIQNELKLVYGKHEMFEMIAPPPSKCSACGRDF